MSFDNERVKLGRRPVLRCELELDRCANTYGVLPCTAPGGPGNECYNTRITCQDPANYDNSESYIFNFSDTLIPGNDAHPAIKSAELAPTVINPDKGLSQRASITVMMGDFIHNDVGTDPYRENRNYDPLLQGTYFGKLMARHRHYIKRPLRIYSGYISEDGYDENDAQVRHYAIQTIEGPDPDGNIRILAKDILKLADDERAQAPQPSTGVLQNNINQNQSTIVVTPGTEGEYSLSEYLRIADEIIFSPFGSRSANTFSSCSRGQRNTTNVPHSAGDGVQSCLHFDEVNVADAVRDLLLTYANIPPVYIDNAQWDDEGATWYSTSLIQQLVTNPEGVTSLINELAEQYFFQIWWDEIAQLINFRAIVPPDFSNIPIVSDADNIVSDSVRVKRDEEKRLTRVLMYYDPTTPIDYTEVQDYAGVYVLIAANEEANYQSIKQREIFARFVDSQATAVQTASRLLSRWVDAPREVQVDIDPKDVDVWTGDTIDIFTRHLQDRSGADGNARCLVHSVQELTTAKQSGRYRIKALELNFAGRYGFIGPDTLLDYPAESEANRDSYGFIAPDSGLFFDERAAYRII